MIHVHRTIFTRKIAKLEKGYRVRGCGERARHMGLSLSLGVKSRTHEDVTRERFFIK